MKNATGGTKAILAVLLCCLLISVGFNVWYLVNQPPNGYDWSSCRNQLQSCQSQLSSVQSQLQSTEDQVSSLQSELSECEGHGNLQEMSVKAEHEIISQERKSKSEIVQFTADYAGFVYVSGESTTSNGYIMVTSSFRHTFGGYPYNDTEYWFGTSNGLIIPVLPGTIRVYFGNDNLINDAEAEITVWYYY